MGARQQPGGEEGAAQQHEARRAEPVRQHAHERRAEPAHELRGGVGERAFRPRPAERLDERHEEDGVGLHHAGADREGRERGGENEPLGAHGAGSVERHAGRLR